MCAQVRRPRGQRTGTGPQRDAVAPFELMPPFDLRADGIAVAVAAVVIAAHALISAECGQFITRHCAGTKVTVQIERQRCFRLEPEVAAESCGQDLERIVTAEGGAVGRVGDTEPTGRTS